jgi:DMSO/TMAO reductase YedYZ molybdopterin-dependent catalytic subunit
MTGEGFQDEDRARRKAARRDIRLAGLLATLVSGAVLWVASSLFTSVPFPPAALADAMIRWVPGGFATFFIDLLEHYAMVLLTGCVLIGTLLAGGEILVRTSVDGRLRPLLAAGTLGVLALIASFLSPAVEPAPPATVAAIGVGGLVYWQVARLFHASITAEPQTNAGRRRALLLGVGGAAAVAAGGGALGWAARRLAGPNTDVALQKPSTSASVPDRGPFPKIAGLTPEVTSADDHYVVDINLIQPSVESDGWSLRVFGEVDRALEIGFDALQREFEVVEDYSVLTCVSNEVGGDLIGHSSWRGVRLADVLSKATALSGAFDVVFRAADGYSDSIPIDLARDPAVLLAIGQNGRPLTQEHGFPCRVRVPPIFGMKNVKWLESIELVTANYVGYWQQRGWSDVATVQTQSRIDVAGDERSARVGAETWVAGVAWAGDRGISSVEVSTDGGRSWRPTDLREPIAKSSWRLWAYRWRPERTGTVEIMCRARDGSGTQQTRRPAPPHPDGATGYHRVPVEVS